MPERKQVEVFDVPSNVREAVERECETRERSLNDTVGSILAPRYGMGWAPSGYPFRGIRDREASWVLRLPVALYDAIKEQAEEIGAAMSRLIVAALAEHFGLPAPSSADRRGKSQPRNASGRFGPRT